MPQKELVLYRYELNPSSKAEGASVRLTSTESGKPVIFSFQAVKPGLFRTTFSSADHPLPPFPSAHKPTTDNSAFVVSEPDKDSRTFQCDNVEAKVQWKNEPIVSVGFSGEKPLHEDLPLRSYALDGPGVAHYTKYARGDLHVGLGEKSAPMDLSNRHFTLTATDCFGYDVLRSDPMYKHIPLLIRATPNGVVATFSTSHARGYYSVGSEMDGMWGYFKVYRQDFGGLEEYTMIGRTLQEVITLYAGLIGYPLLVPRWAFGYLGGGMRYSMLDEPRASEALIDFADKLKKYDIPCSGFQMSSGYTVAEQEPKTRNVFTWNKHRFPDPKGFCDEYHKRGIRLIANIKPYILANHPAYEGLKKDGAFFTDPRTGETGIARLWSAGGGTSGEGGHIDFTSTAGYDFWYNNVRKLRLEGMDCMWNDNNEYLLPSDNWQIALNSQAAHEGAIPEADQKRNNVGFWGRAMHTELMGKASHDALLEAVPHERPFVLTRSATAGTMRYACSSWSGDNVTSWDGMRGANALSLNAGMSLLQCYGHDIGGFEGPQPSPELLVRWVQLGCHSPRFAINCYKTGNDSLIGDVIEPWMYPETLPEVRKAIMRRYEMIPYIYGLMLLSTRTALPPQRWTGWGYESDPEVWTSKLIKDGETQYWLGDTLLIGGVYEPGVRDAKVYLPRKSTEDAGFLNTNAPYQYLSAGRWHTISSPWRDSIPVLARVGGAVPVGLNRQVVAPGDKANEASLPADDWRGVEIFPPPEEMSDSKTWYSNTWLEDDGISPPPAKIAGLTVSYVASPKEVAVKFQQDVGAFEPPWVEKGLTVVLPVGDSRSVASAGGATVEPRRPDEQGRRRYHLVVQPEANGHAEVNGYAKVNGHASVRAHGK
ncbi:glycoside hydrolase family 31 protein [Baudoinia panamericana UAMH 10762]|uniref:alpha-glucosidase n=1 Tax=Baudoinia panamericana (strain UAMH 10762) TaxID=717646 RepID=M2MSR5_BAUPA|nr:glycoside hydrolase family 31 protein [Baudoinia panamericana UAMH 10762]EMC94538.1 glycoside hydrolase family 31 protein [Baudoinia panamericana UAMH 10762]